jgi:CheY-like chemotaxis protein
MYAHLLVVDDDESIRTTLAVILHRGGHEVACAADGKEALGKMREDPPDLVLLDLMMPGMGGWDVLAAMRENPRLADIPVVVLTSLHDDANAPPGQPVLRKPVDDEIVRAVVDTLLMQKQRAAFALKEPPSARLARLAPR